MFDHVWRRTRDTFYLRGYHGIDWQGGRPIYAKYLPYIGDNYDFAEMLSEMTKPSVEMANESNYSDGHCFAYAYKAQKIGPLVGMPTPGTCTFSGWESLQDGIRWGVPGVGVKDATTGKFLENSQTVPDIQVRDDYDVAAKGRDQQLEAAVAALLRLILATRGAEVGS